MAGLTSDGFVAKTLEEIQAGFEARQRADIDPTLDTTQFSLIGQLNGIMASEIAQLWELGEELHDAMDPDKAEGVQQDALYALTATLRRGESKSRVIETVVLDPGANIAAGDAQVSVAGNPTAKFVNVTPMVNAGGVQAPFLVVFESVDFGPIVANAGTLTNIDTPGAGALGWVSATNVEDAEPGSLVERDPAYRIRREEELAAQGGGTPPGIRAELLKIPTVRAATVIENTTNAAVDSMPAKSFDAVVRSDVGALDDEEIAQTIWENKPAGMESYGSVSVVIEDEEGFAQTVKFSRPTERAVYVALRLLTTTGYLGDAATKAALVDASEDQADVAGYLDVGDDVYAGKLAAVAMKLPGVLNAEARVSTAAIGTYDTAPSTVVIAPREIADLDTSRITIVPFP